MGKTEIIETLQVSIRIAKDAIEVLKKSLVIKSAESVNLKVRNAELTAINESTNNQLTGLNREITRLKEENENLKIDGTDFKKPRTYFDVASSEPIKLFGIGDTVHVIRDKVGILYNLTTLKSEVVDYPLSLGGTTFKTNGKYLSENKLRQLFTTAEMIEMGYTIPDLE